MSRLALRGAKVHLQVTKQSLREEYKRRNSEAYEVIKRLQHLQVSIVHKVVSIYRVIAALHLFAATHALLCHHYASVVLHALTS